MEHGDVLKSSARATHNAMLDVEDYLTLNEEVVIKDQRVLREVDGSFDGILDRDEPVFDFSSLDGIQHVRHCGIWNALERSEIGLAQQSLLGERAGWSKICDSSARCRHVDQG